MASIGRQTQQRQATGSSQGQTFVDPSQAPFLQFLRQQGQALTEQQLGQVPQAIGAAGQQLGQAGAGFLGNLQQLAAPGGGAPGQSFLEQRVSQENPFLNEQIQALGADLGQQFRESILPGIRRNAVGIGGLGGGRQGVAEGLAAEGATRQFAQQAANLRAQDVALRQAAATTLGQQQLQGAAAGIDSLAPLFGLQTAGFGAQFQPLQQFAGLIGGPTILSQQRSQQQSSGRGSGFNLGFGTLFTG